MSATSAAPENCPICGRSLPGGARFCPSCGHRIDASQLPRDEFLDAIDAAAGEDAYESEQPTIQAPVVAGPVAGPSPPGGQPPGAPAPPFEPAWSATPEQWPADVAERSRGGWRQNRTLWIILAIFGFIVFCCCGILFSLFIAASVDSSFQSEISWVATILA